jgi:tetratricopeptide (TPR) repeat protein
MSSSEAEWMLMLETRLKARDTEASEIDVKVKAGRYRGILGEPIDKESSLNKSLLDLQSSLVKEATLKQDSEALKMQQEKEIDAAGKEQPIEGPKDEFTGLEGLDVYDQMKLKAYADRDLYEQRKIEEPVDGKDETEKTEKKIRLILDETGQKQIEMTDVKAQSLTGIEKSALAKGVLGSYKSFASYSNDKFNHHMRKAEDHLKKGEYYLADNSYSMAWIYKTGDPLVYAGRCHSLFMAGEYMSSALFLSRAINTFPEYAQLEIDIETLIGDRDGIETRLADVEELLKLRDVAELHFAAAYFYYNLGRRDKAREHIDAAYGKLPEMHGVKELKEVIEATGKK